MDQVNPYMDNLETEACLALARFYDSPLPSRHERISEINDPKPEECATKDAPVWVEKREIEIHT
jgi:hypothetical protein